MYSGLHPHTYYSVFFSSSFLLFFFASTIHLYKVGEQVNHHVRVPKFQNPPAGSEILPRK